jgi:hypothetical protein
MDTLFDKYNYSLDKAKGFDAKQENDPINDTDSWNAARS